MANFVTANLAKYQAKIAQSFNSGELRFRTPAVFNSIRKSTEIMVPSHNQIKNAAKRTTGEINFFNRASRALGNGGETALHVGAKSDSSVLIPAWTAFDDKFYYSLKQANNSVFELDEMIMNEMTNVFINFTEGLESAAASFLHNGRTGVNAYSRQGTFNAANDVFEIVADTTNVLGTGYRAVQIIKSAIEANKWTGVMLTAYCDTVMYDKLQVLAAQGQNNAQNSSFQFSGVEFLKSVEMDALAVALGYADGYCVVAPMGTVATLDWIPQQNRDGIITSVSKYGTILAPNVNLALATHSYEANVDENGNNSEKQDVRIETQFFTYLSFNYAPLTTADETPLFAFAFVPQGV